MNRHIQKLRVSEYHLVSEGEEPDISQERYCNLADAFLQVRMYTKIFHVNITNTRDYRSLVHQHQIYHT